MYGIKEHATYDIVGMGEVLLRLTPPDKEKINQSETFCKNAGGSELNVLSGASILGAKTAYLTKLPENALGEYIRRQIRYAGVADGYVVSDTSENARLGVYFYERGAAPRKSAVVYDRKGASVTTFTEGELPAGLFESTRIFHISSITFALSKTLRDTAFTVLRGMKEAGVTVSFDVNYRAALWSEEAAREVVERILPYVDILFVSHETSSRMLQRKGTTEQMMAGFARDYGCRVVASTNREAVSPTLQHFSSTLYYDGKFYTEPAYRNIETVDRIGSGDAYVGGVLYAISQGLSPAQAVSYGNACSAACNTTTGDLPVCTRREIDRMIRTHQEGSQSEMER